MVSGNGGDPLVDREKELATLMEEKGVKVMADFKEGGHGRGFIYFSPSSSASHDFYSKMESGVKAAVASVTYRLASEHRLPAVYKDAMEALHRIKTNPNDYVSTLCV
ncbi:hypothetical protein K1719_039846 [Acacia pycnantha]|nr:hypothetical protein K1719_039846 [Acacia pycnantha]